MVELHGHLNMRDAKLIDGGIGVTEIEVFTFFRGNKFIQGVKKKNQVVMLRDSFDGEAG